MVQNSPGADLDRFGPRRRSAPNVLAKASAAPRVHRESGGQSAADGRRTLGGMDLPSADDRLLREAAGLLAELAPRHGITAVELGTDPAELVVTLKDGRTYFDLAEFEAEAEALLRHRVSVTSSGAPGAHPRESLAPAPAA